MKIKNKKSLFFGILLTCASIFMMIVPGNTIKGNPFNEWYMQLIALILGILLIFYGLLPESRLGSIGKKIYNFYSWVHKENKKK